MKPHVQVMGSADAAARVQAFLLVREMGSTLPAPMLSSAMKVRISDPWWLEGLYDCFHIS